MAYELVDVAWPLSIRALRALAKFVMKQVVNGTRSRDAYNARKTPYQKCKQNEDVDEK